MFLSSVAGISNKMKLAIALGELDITSIKFLVHIIPSGGDLLMYLRHIHCNSFFTPSKGHCKEK
jgi:hypothetical protein